MKKLLDYWGACRIAAGTDRKLRYKKHNWMRLCEDGRLHDDLSASHAVPYTFDQQKEKAWEVEPEEITVWGLCDIEGLSGLYNDNPLNYAQSELSSEIFLGYLPKENLFSKVESQIYKLVPVGEND